MVLKRIGPLSLAKISGVLCLVLGLVFGFIVARGLLGSGFHTSRDLLGLKAPIVFSLLYGVLGFLGGLIMAALYNLAALVTGGIQLDLR